MNRCYSSHPAATSIAKLIPSHNDATKVARVVADFSAQQRGSSRCVDGNNSSDETAPLAREVEACVRHKPLRGEGNVVRLLLSNIGAVDTFIMHVLEHVPQAQVVGLLAVVGLALVPSGPLGIELPTMANPLVGKDYRYANFTHETGFTSIGVEQVLKIVGFAEVEVAAFRNRGGPLARYAQRIARAFLEFLMSVAWVLYLGHFENVCVNFAAVAKRAS